jgi:hypothetical protein
MNLVEQIEQLLGKDHLPNEHWTPEIPPAWAVVTRQGIQLTGPDVHDVTLEQAGISYKFNNLGYRSNFDYLLDELKTQELILVISDSDGMGRGVEFDNIFSSLIQSQCSETVVNLSVPSLSPDGVARILTKSILALGSSVKHVCLLWPGFSTREFVSKKFQGGIYSEINEVPYADWWDHIDWVSNNYNYRKNQLLIAQTVKTVGAELHELIINRNRTPIDGMFTYLPSQGKSISQLSVESHIAISNYFLKKIR